MAIEKTIIVKANTSQAEKSFEDLGKVIQEQTDITIEFEKELQDLEQQLKDTPKGSLAAQKQLKDRIGGIKNALTDQKVALKSLNNERKKASVATKANIKETLDNGGAVALLDTVTGGMASRTRDAFEATKLFNFSLKGTKTALIATGIGAFVVALGLVVAYWDEIVEFIGGANKKLQKQIDLGARQTERLQAQLDILEIQKTTLENQGKSTAQIKIDIEETLEKQLLQAETNLELLKSQQQIELSKAGELSIWNKIQVAAGGTLGFAQVINEEEQERLENIKTGIEVQEKGIASIRLKQSEAEKEKREGLKETADLEKAAIDKRQKEIDKELLKFKETAELKKKQEQAKIEKEISDKKEKDDALFELEKSHVERLKDFLAETEIEKIELELEREIAELERLEASEEQKFAIRQFYASKIVQVEKSSSDAIATKKEEESDKEEQDAKNLANAKIAIASSVFSIVASVAKKGSALAKGAAVAQATIDTYKSAVAAYAAGSSVGGPAGVVMGPLSAALAVTAGLLNVKKILSTNESGTGGVGASAPSAPAIPSIPQAPSFDLVQGTGTNQIAEGLAQQNQPIEAFVVSSNVTTAQSLDRNIIENAEI